MRVDREKFKNILGGIQSLVISGKLEASWGHTSKVSVKRKHVSLRKWISFFCPALLPTEIRFGTTDRVGQFEQRWAEIR